MDLPILAILQPLTSYKFTTQPSQPILIKRLKH